MGKRIDVPDAVMKQIYARVKTPFKYGIILKGQAGKKIDCPNVFRHGGKWYMIYVCMNVVGYETHLTQSSDLLNFKKLGKILTFTEEDWDMWQADGGLALMDYRWAGTCELQKFDDKNCPAKNSNECTVISTGGPLEAGRRREICSILRYELSGL